MSSALVGFMEVVHEELYKLHWLRPFEGIIHSQERGMLLGSSLSQHGISSSQLAVSLRVTVQLSGHLSVFLSIGNSGSFHFYWKN
jgi:hypothetical protein